MKMPTYDGIIEKWKVELITQRAKRYRFKKYEIPDILQELVLEIRHFRYDPEHAEGATESTALTSVIDNQLRNRRRSATRYNAHVENYGLEVTEFSPDEVNTLAMDLCSLILKLPQQEQAVCRALAQGYTRSDIARQLGCSWQKVNRIVDSLQKHFHSLQPEGAQQ